MSENNPYLIEMNSDKETGDNISLADTEQAHMRPKIIYNDKRAEVMSIKEYENYIAEMSGVDLTIAQNHVLQTWLDNPEKIGQELTDYEAGTIHSENIIAPRIKLFSRWLQFMLVSVMRLAQTTEKSYDEVLENTIVIYGGFYSRHGQLPDVFETLDIIRDRGRNLTNEELPKGPHLILVDPHTNASNFEIPQHYQNLTKVVQAKLSSSKMRKINESWTRQKKKGHETHILSLTDCRSDTVSLHMIDKQREMLILTMGELAQCQTPNKRADRDLDGRLDIGFCDSFQLERQMTKKPDIFFQDVQFTDVPNGKGHKRAAAKPPTRSELEQMRELAQCQTPNERYEHLLRQAAFLALSGSELSLQLEACINADNQAQASWAGTNECIFAWSGKIRLKYNTYGPDELHPFERETINLISIGLPYDINDCQRDNSTEITARAIRKTTPIINPSLSRDAIHEHVDDLFHEMMRIISRRDTLGDNWYDTNRKDAIRTEQNKLIVNNYADCAYFDVDKKTYDVPKIDKIFRALNSSNIRKQHERESEYIIQGLLNSYCGRNAIIYQNTNTYKTAMKQIERWSKRGQKTGYSRQANIEGSFPKGRYYANMLHCRVNKEWGKIMKNIGTISQMEEIQHHIKKAVETNGETYTGILEHFKREKNPFHKLPVYFTYRDLPSQDVNVMNSDAKKSLLCVLSNDNVMQNCWWIVALHAKAHFMSIRETSYYKIFLPNQKGRNYFGDVEHPMLQNHISLDMALYLKVICEHFLISTNYDENGMASSIITAYQPLHNKFRMLFENIIPMRTTEHKKDQFVYFAMATSIFMLTNAFNMSGRASLDVKAIQLTRDLMNRVGMEMIQAHNLQQTEYPCYPMSITSYHTGLTTAVKKELVASTDFVAQFYFYVLPCLPSKMTMAEFHANYESVMHINNPNCVSCFVRDINETQPQKTKSIFEWPGLTTAQQMTATPELLKAAIVHTYKVDPRGFKKRLKTKSTNGTDLLAKSVYLGDVQLVGFLLGNDLNDYKSMFQNNKSFTDFKTKLLELWDPELAATYYLQDAEQYVSLIRDNEQRQNTAKTPGFVMSPKSYPYNTDSVMVSLTKLQHMENLMVNYQNDKFKYFFDTMFENDRRGFPVNFELSRGYKMKKPACVSYYWCKLIRQITYTKQIELRIARENISFVDYDTRMGEDTWFLACLCTGSQFFCIANQQLDEAKESEWEQQIKKLSDTSYEIKTGDITLQSSDTASEDIFQRYSDLRVVIVDCCEMKDVERVKAMVDKAFNYATHKAQKSIVFVLFDADFSETKSKHISTALYPPDDFGGWTKTNIGPENTNKYVCYFTNN